MLRYGNRFDPKTMMAYTIGPISPEQRKRAIAVLREKAYRGCPQAEKILGWTKSFGMPETYMATPLNLTKGQLRYMLGHEEWNRQARARRAAAAQAEAVEYLPYLSKLLRFTIALPRGWTVIAETLEPHPLSREFLQWLPREKDDKQFRQQRTRGNRSKIVLFRDFQQAEGRCEERLDEARRHADPERMVTGLIQASGPDEVDNAQVEVSRLRLSAPLSALELYTTDKSLPADVPWGSRPAKGMVIDGLHAVTYSYLYDTGDAQQEWPVFFKNYLADGLDGWIISCSCNYGGFSFKTFSRYKPLFQRIAGSFRRLRAL